MSEGDIEWRAFFLIGLTALVLAFVVAVLWQSSAARHGGQPPVATGALAGAGRRAGESLRPPAQGAVTDFLDFYIASYHWPTFNVADSGITVGACLVLLDLWLSRRKAGET